LFEQVHQEFQFLRRPFPVFTGKAIERKLLDAEPSTFFGDAADALHAAFNPFESGSGLSVTDVVVLAVWGIAGVVFAMKKFSWEPHR
jgi:hypothetical protein